MAAPLEARPFDGRDVAAISEFISRCSRGALDPAWADEIFTTVIGEAGAVRDLWLGSERVALGISIDGLETEGNAAELSLFCSAGDPDACAALLDWGEARIRAAGRDRVDIPHWPGTDLPAELLQARGYRIGHVMYEMTRPAAAAALPPPRTPLRQGWRWARASERHARAYYETLCSAWAGIPSAFVAPFASFCRRVESFEETPWLLLSDDAATPVAGFVRVERHEDGGGRICALGRHADYRGLGLGEHLMVRGLGRLEELGAGYVTLEVAAGNAAGLALYEAFGFEVTRETVIYSRAVAGG